MSQCGSGDLGVDRRERPTGIERCRYQLGPARGHEIVEIKNAPGKTLLQVFGKSAFELATPLALFHPPRALLPLDRVTII